MTTQESNKLIAEFDGWSESFIEGLYIKEGHRGALSPESMPYETDWSWLMPVWFKVQHIGADMGYKFKKIYEEFHAGIDLQSIMKCYRACLNFIQLYNELNASKHGTE